MVSGFRAFVMRGNVVDLAVAVIIGAAFTKIVTSLTEDVIMPAVGALIGDADFSRYFILLDQIPATFRGDPNSYAALKAAGVPMIGYGALITAAVNFLLVAFVIYLMIKALKRAMADKDKPAAADPADVALLREIRDELRAARTGTAPSTSH
jgi:large conductance mechanosensitive channel